MATASTIKHTHIPLVLALPSATPPQDTHQPAGAAPTFPPSPPLGTAGSRTGNHNVITHFPLRVSKLCTPHLYTLALMELAPQYLWWAVQY